MKTPVNLLNIGTSALLACAAEEAPNSLLPKLPWPPLPSSQHHPLSELSDSISRMNLLRHSQVLEDIAYSTPARNRFVGADGHYGTLNYILHELQYATDRHGNPYYRIDWEPFNLTVWEYNTTFNVNGVDIAPLYATAEAGYWRDAQIVPIANFGCNVTDFPSDMSGAIALLARGALCPPYVVHRLAKKAGAVAMVVYDKASNLHASSRTRSSPTSEWLPSIEISQANAAKLLCWAANATARGSLSIGGKEKTVRTSNIIATSRDAVGGDDSDVLMIGAHSDSVIAGPGMNDNGSGLVAILEVARQLAKHGWSTKRRVRFAFWTGEELGFKGSQWYIDNTPREKLAKIKLYLNFDMLASPNYKLGIYDGDGSAFNHSGPRGSAFAEKLFEGYFNVKGYNHTEDNFSVAGSDDRPFAAAGIPVGGIFTGANGNKMEKEAEMFGGTANEPYDPNYHTSRDTVANLNLDALEINAKAIAAAVQHYLARGFPERNTTKH